MSDKSFTIELHRARDREDTSTLLRDLADYHQYSREVQSREEYVGVVGGNFACVMDAHNDDPDKGMAYLALAMAHFEDREFLGLLSAGLLEDLLRDPRPEMLDRIVTEARKTPRFRWMLSGVWLHAIAERARAPVAGAVGDFQLEDPMPPAPF